MKEVENQSIRKSSDDLEHPISIDPIVKDTLEAIKSPMQLDELLYQVNTFLDTLSGFQQSQIIREMLIVIKLAGEIKHKRKAADILSIITRKVKKNKDVHREIEKLVKSTDTNDILSAYCILKSLIIHKSIQHFEVIQYIKDGLYNGSFQHNMLSLECMALYLQQNEVKIDDKMEDCAKMISLTVFKMVQNHQNENGLFILHQVIKKKPSFFSKMFDALIKELMRISQNPIQLQAKIQAVQIIDSIAESPAFNNRQTKNIKRTVEKLAILMAQHVTEASQEWMNSSISYDKKEEKIVFTVKAYLAITHLIAKIQTDQIGVYLSDLIQRFLKKKDWRFRFVGLRLFPRLQLYFVPYKLVQEIRVLIRYIHDANPKLRHAACQAAGIIFYQTSSEYYRMFGDLFLTEISCLLYREQVPIIIEEASEALSRLIEGLRYQQISNHLVLMVPKLLGLINYQKPTIKMCALDVISSLVQISQDKYVPFLQQTITILFEAFQSAQVGRNTQLRYLQTLSIIAVSVKIDMFAPWFHRLFQRLIHTQIILLNNQPQRIECQVIQDAWIRLCIAYPQQFMPYINDLIPNLFLLIEKAVSQIIVHQQRLQEWNEIEEKYLEHIVSILHTLGSLMKQFSQNQFPFSGQIMSILVVIAQNFDDLKVRATVCDSAYFLKQNLLSQQPQPLRNLVKLTIYHMIESMKQIADIDLLLKCTKSLQRICNVPKLFIEQQLVSFLQMLNQMLLAVDEKTNFFQRIHSTFSKEQIQKMKFQMSITRLVNILFKSYGPISNQFAEFVLYKLFIRQPSKTKQTLSLNLYLDLMALIVSQLYPQRQIKEERRFESVLNRYSKDKNLSLRSSACRGIGNLIMKIPSDQHVDKRWLDRLVKAFNFPFDPEGEEVAFRCQDIIIAAYGNSLWTHRSLKIQRCLYRWVELLPLRRDVEEDNAQILLLSRFCLDKLIIFDDFVVPRLETLLKLYGKVIVNIRYYNEPVMNWIRSHLSQFFYEVNLDAKLQRNLEMINPILQDAIVDFMQR